jgi:hypothetical protein
VGAAADGRIAARDVAAGAGLGATAVEPDPHCRRDPSGQAQSPALILESQRCRWSRNVAVGAATLPLEPQRCRSMRADELTPTRVEVYTRIAEVRMERVRLVLFAWFVGALMSCSSASSSEHARYTVGGTVKDLNGTLVLVNGAASVTLSASGAFVFPGTIEDGQPYAVVVASQPKGQLCFVSGGSGIVQGANVSSVAIVCSPDVGYKLGGKVGGLAPLGQVVLTNKGLSSTVVSKDGDFTFAQPLHDGDEYAVGVLLQPKGQTCTIDKGMGTVKGKDVTDVVITCGLGSPGFSVGGTIAGLAGGKAVLYQAQGGEALVVDKDGAFTFPTKLPDGGEYMVLVVAPPTGRACTVTKGAGKIQTSDVIDVKVTCLGDDAKLSSLSLIEPAEVPKPTFDPKVTSYGVEVGLLAQTIRVVASASDKASVVRVNGSIVASGTPSAPIALNLGVTGIVVTVAAESGKEQSYFVEVARAAALAQSIYGKASNPDLGDRLGLKVAVSGDTIAVAAPYEASKATGVNGDQKDNSMTEAGAVYVFVRADGVWKQQAYLKASNTDAEDFFGLGLAIDGDTIVVGAPVEDSKANTIDGDQKDNSSMNSGAAYVFVRKDGMWTQQAYLKASNNDPFDRFGASVAVLGDIVVVGVPNEDSTANTVNGSASNNDGNNHGAAFVFERSGVVWKETAYLKAANSGGDDRFGFAVGVSGNTVVVTAPQEDSKANVVNGDGSNDSTSDAGAAYVFVKGMAGWSQEAYLKAGNTGPGFRFGQSAAISGNTVVVGAPQENYGIGPAGAAYLFARSAGKWVPQTKLVPDSGDSGDAFGEAVAIFGDRVVVGASGEASKATGVDGNASDNSESGSGAAYLFSRTDTALWVQTAYLKASNTGAFDKLGSAVAIWGQTIVLASPDEDSSAAGINGNQNDNNLGSTGAFYVFR